MDDGALVESRLDARMEAAVRDATGEDGRIDTALPCGSCGYRLTGLRVDDVCSECGHPIVRSLRPDRWAFCSPRLVAGLRAGLSWLAVSFALSAAAPIVRGITTFFAARLLMPGAPTTAYYRWNYGAGLMVGLAIGIPLIIGICLITRRGMHPASDRRTWWPVTRWLAPIDVGFGALIHINLVLVPSLMFAAIGPLFWIRHVLSTVVVVMVVILMRDVARRIPDDGISRQLTWVFWTFLATAIVEFGWQITFQVLVNVMTPTTLGSFNMIYALAVSVLTIAIFAWLALIAVRIRRRVSSMHAEGIVGESST